MGRVRDLFNGMTLSQDAQRQLLLADKEYGEVKAKLQVCQADNLKLQAEVNPLKREVEKLKEEIRRLTEPKEEYETVLGCMKFVGDPLLYCPGCHANKGKKVPTSRKSTKYRFCAACKTEIPAG